MGSCTSAPTFADLCVDLENPQTSNSTEQQIGSTISSLIVNNDILSRFSEYKDAQQETNAAISNPSEETNEAAWSAVLPLIEFQSELFEYAKKVSEEFRNVLNFLLSKYKNGSNDTDFIEQHEVAINAICEIAEVVLKFDSIKMRLPKLLGDLSFFRRSAPRRNDFTEDYENLYVKSTEMTMFFANSNPLLNKCVEIVQTEYVKQPPEMVKILSLCAAVVDLLASTEKYHKFNSDQTNIKCLTGMCFMLLVFDFLATNGAFHSKSPIHVKEALGTLKGFSPKQTELINTIKYSAKHLSDDSTPPAIKELVSTT